jgi:hypothetical protein
LTRRLVGRTFCLPEIRSQHQQTETAISTYIGLLDSPVADEKIEVFLSEDERGEMRVMLRSIARSQLGWYPQKTLSLHPSQLAALELVVKRARRMLAARDGGSSPPHDPEVIRLPYGAAPDLIS